jgi:molybdenum cofactor cytidylyltransferase
MEGLKRIGVLLAAGRSTRMGRPKQLLPWPPNAADSKPLVAAAFDAIAYVCDAMVVVVGHEADAVIAALGERDFGAVAVDGGAEMIASVKAGLAVARGIDPDAIVLLHPADHPKVRRETLDLLIQIAADYPGRAVMPTFGEAGGHPVLIAAELIIPIVSYEGSGGLRQFWIDYADQCIRVSVDDSGIVLDLDTQFDYDRSVQ